MILAFIGILLIIGGAISILFIPFEILFILWRRKGKKPVKKQLWTLLIAIILVILAAIWLFVVQDLIPYQPPSPDCYTDDLGVVVCVGPA